MQNPIEMVVLDSNGELKPEILQEDVDRLLEQYRYAQEQVRQHSIRPNGPSRKNDFDVQRRSLRHFYNDHWMGYIPLAELPFLRDEELEGLKFVPTSHAYQYFAANDQFQGNFLTQYNAITISLQHETLEHLSDYLLGRTSLKDYAIKLDKEVQRQVHILQKYDNSIDFETAQNAVMGLVLCSSFNIAKTYDDNNNVIDKPDFQFGSTNKGDRINALHLPEEIIDFMMKRDKDDLHPKNAHKKFQEWGSYTDKLSLYLDNVQHIANVKSLVSKQHNLLYEDTKFEQEIGKYSNEFFALKSYVNYQYENNR